MKKTIIHKNIIIDVTFDKNNTNISFWKKGNIYLNEFNFNENGELIK